MLIDTRILAENNTSHGLKQITLAVGISKPPYILDKAKRGIEIEWVSQILNSAGFSVRYIELPTSRSIKMLEAGHVDGVMTIKKGLIDGGKYFFSDEYISYKNFAITLKKQKLKVNRIDDLAEYPVIAFKNAKKLLGKKYRKTVSENDDYREVSKQVIQNKMLSSGRTHVAIADKRIFSFYHKKLGLNDFDSFTFHPIFPESRYRIVFANKMVRNAFNKSLRSLQTTSLFSTIENKY